MATRMTPLSSSRSSPIRNSSPPRHNTPVKIRRNSDVMKKDNSSSSSSSSSNSSSNNVLILGGRDNHLNHVEILEGCHMSKLDLVDPCRSKVSLQSYDEKDSVHSSMNVATVENRRAVEEGINMLGSFTLLETRTAAWEEAEQAKCVAKYNQEKARIEAWETLQRARAEAKLKRLEVNLEKLRAKAIEKVSKKVASLERHANQKRVAAESKQARHMSNLRARTSNLHTLFPCNNFCKWSS